MLSARFPYISPEGSIRANGEPKLGDRVVDGGYYENSGLTTAIEVARAIRGFGLTPIVLSVQNEPKLDDTDLGVDVFSPSAGGLSPARGEATQGAFEGVSGPFKTLLSTRNIRSVEKAREAQTFLERLSQESMISGETVDLNWFKFAIYRHPRFTADAAKSVRELDSSLDAECNLLQDADLRITVLPMSWWLSQSVQAEIDAEICDLRNRKSLTDLLSRLSQSIPVAD
jgi:hypothetical protein